MIVGIVGQLGSGKDYIVNNYIIPYLNDNDNDKDSKVHIISMADALKVELMIKDNNSFDKLYIIKDKKTRQRLQEYGTDICRKEMGEDIWIRYVDAWIQIYKLRGKKLFIIPDIRFENEAEYVTNNGGVLVGIEANDRNDTKIEQENLTTEVNHISETGVNDIECTYYLDNSKKNQNNVENDVYEILQVIEAGIFYEDYMRD